MQHNHCYVSEQGLVLRKTDEDKWLEHDTIISKSEEKCKSLLLLYEALQDVRGPPCSTPSPSSVAKMGKMN